VGRKRLRRTRNAVGPKFREAFANTPADESTCAFGKSDERKLSERRDGIEQFADDYATK